MKGTICLVLLFSSLVVLAQTKTIGTIERLDAELATLIKEGATIEVIGDGYAWAEGPVWVASHNMLLFSDIPNNAVYKWTAANGVKPYLKPSGYTGTQKRGGETGSNGLLLMPNGSLLLCQHGNRQLALMNAPLDAPKPRYTPIATQYNGKKFNSPNDATLHSDGDIYFTDPPYGLEKNMDDPTKELPFQGVYKISKEGRITLVLDSITRPNGIGFSPDEKTMVIANSDHGKAVWYAYDIDQDGTIQNGRILMDATAEFAAVGGAPDGLKFSRAGYLFATGPGGVWIFNKAFRPIGRIRLPVAAANCALSTDEKTLYITATNYLLRLQMQ